MHSVFKNLLAVLAGLLISILLVIVIDKVFGWVTNTKVSRSHFFAQSTDTDGLGWSARNEGKLVGSEAGYTLKHKETAADKVLFDVTYNFDDLYRRNVTGTPSKEVDKFVLFFGGSQTFGEGLDDQDTIPSLIQKSAPDHRVYNYAYKGYGPHQMLKKLQTNTLATEVAEGQGIAFFQYFDFHVQRAVGTLSYVSWAGGRAPYYTVNDVGQLEQRGSFATGRFWTTLLYWILGKSAIATHYRVELPRNISEYHHDLVCQVITASRDEFLNQYPHSRFVVVLGMTKRHGDPIVESCLEKYDLEFVDLRRKGRRLNGLKYPHNGHLTPKATRLIAKKLAPVVNAGNQ
ncbi:Uncharacterised protein [Halioglobus japonicus]|nr:Uncharacterised protein [Halioglobus japonicus]